VSLFAPHQRPVWSNVIGKEKALVTLPAGKPLEIETRWACLYELLPPDQRRGPYRLTVELRQIDSIKGLEVGPYVGREEHALPGGSVHTFALCGFADPDLLRMIDEPPGLLHRHAGLLIGHLEPRGAAESPRTGFILGGATCPLAAPARPGPGEPAFYTLIVDSRRAAIRVRCANKGGSAAVARLQFLFRAAQRRQPRFRAVRPSFAPSGGAGLFVIGGAIEVRRVLVEPLN
jgi:hypothetical protein